VISASRGSPRLAGDVHRQARQNVIYKSIKEERVIFIVGLAAVFIFGAIAWSFSPVAGVIWILVCLTPIVIAAVKAFRPDPVANARFRAELMARWDDQARWRSVHVPESKEYKFRVAAEKADRPPLDENAKRMGFH
jgi:type IV secretory pathway TrbD component